MEAGAEIQCGSAAPGRLRIGGRFRPSDVGAVDGCLQLAISDRVVQQVPRLVSAVLISILHLANTGCFM